MVRKILALIFVGLFFSVTTSAQNPIKASLVAPSAAIKAGQTFTLRLTVQIPGGWHIYSLSQPPGGPARSRISLDEDEVFKSAGPITAPKPQTYFDPNFEISTETHQGTVQFGISVKISAEAASARRPLTVAFLYQACTEISCLPPKTIKLESEVQILVLQKSSVLTPAVATSPIPKPSSPRADGNASLKPSPTPEATTTTVNAPRQGSEARALEVTPRDSVESRERSSLSGGSIWAFLWLAMTMGALSLLTPCVFPMIPITVSYFTNHAVSSKWIVVRNAGVYAAGIILTFTGLGVIAAIFFGAAGTNRFAASPWLNLVIAGIFVAFALSLFGAYSISISTKVLTKLDIVSRRRETSEKGSTLVGLLLMAVIFALTSFTCTAPFIGSLMVMAARGSWTYPILGLLSFSMVFALPFFVLALAPQMIGHLPRSGGWLNSVKVVMGFLEIAAAMKFLSNADLVWHWGIISREIVLSVWIAVAVFISLYSLGLFHLVHDDKPASIGPPRLLMALLSLSVSFWLVTGLFGARLGEIESFLPPVLETRATADPTAPTAVSQEPRWILNDYDEALRQARNQHKLLLIDFTGYTCTNCRWMEANMFTRSSIRRALDNYVRVRLYTDGAGEIFQRHQQMEQSKFGTVALPYYAIVNGNGDAVASFPGLTRNEEEFLAFLDRPPVLSLNAEDRHVN